MATDPGQTDRRFPPIEPYDSGMLDVGDGQQIYWEAVGNPNGTPAVYLHGGPGSGFSAGQRRFFDPERYNAILFDQRGCGRSTPLAEESPEHLRVNTTQHLISDIEALRELRGIERWGAVLGLSWGSTLGLAYAEAHPERVAGLVLGLVTTGARRDIEWITQDVGRIFPREWERFVNAIPAELRHMRPVDAYARMLIDPDPAVVEHAALEWCIWEDAHVSLTPGHTPSLRYEDPTFRLRFARLVTHYWSNDCFLGANGNMENAGKLAGIPGILIHGIYDVSGPLDVPWQLMKVWPDAELIVLDDAGHGGLASFPNAVVDALNRLADG
jgi:proline iminopeptidase